MTSANRGTILSATLPFFLFWANSAAAQTDASVSQSPKTQTLQSTQPLQREAEPIIKPEPGQTESAKTEPTKDNPIKAAPTEPKALERFLTERYMQYHQAMLNAASLDDLYKYKPTAMAEKMKKDMATKADTPEKKKQAEQAMLGLMKLMLPQNIKITSVKVTGDHAELTATATDSGTLMDGIEQGMGKLVNGMAAGLGAKSSGPKAHPAPMRTTGKIAMVKEAGEWKIAEESWNSTNASPQQEATRKASDSWCTGALAQAFPQKAAAGVLHGQPFTVQGAELSSNNILTLRQGSDFFEDRGVKIFIFGPQTALDGEQIFIKPGESPKRGAHVHMSWKGTRDIPENKIFMDMDGLGMKLAFGRRKGNSLPGYIVLRLPDKDKSYVAGYFYAQLK